MVLFVHVLWDMSESSANSMLVPVNWILVGMTVSDEQLVVVHLSLVRTDDPCFYFYFSVGVCNHTSNGTFNCHCRVDWEGYNCERKVDHCRDEPCLNKGACRHLVGSYQCECLEQAYSGLHCETPSRRIRTLQLISKSFGYVAISALSCVTMFIVLMDILNYGFGIDPVCEERAKIREKKRAKRRQSVIVERFLYVPQAPVLEPVNEQTSSAAEMVV